jgi:UDP-N-acetylglucosamine 1-carboxyvinyltransferase
MPDREKFVIEGGARLSGEMTPGGNKNEVLPCLAASLLTDQPVTLRNVPRIKDVGVMLSILEGLGSSVEWVNENTVRIQNKQITTTEPPEELCARVRASILFAGALLGRAHRVLLPPPGGDVIGRRRLDTHFLGFQALGAAVESTERGYLIEAEKLVGGNIFLDEASVTGTENIVMAAVLARGTTVLRNAACEPHVQGLCRMLEGMGAQIDGIGTHVLRIHGQDCLGGISHRIGPDYLEIGSFIALAAITGGELVINDVVAEDLRMVRVAFGRLGVRFNIEGGRVFVPGDQDLVVRHDFHGEIPQVDDAPWPGFPTDLMSIAITVATQSRGTVLFFEKMFEGRMFFTDSLKSMGARIILCDPHRAVVVGPAQLYGTTLDSPDVRAGMSLLIASLVARGQSTIYNIRQIDRGYERVDEKLRSLGACIERVTV